MMSTTLFYRKDRRRLEIHGTGETFKDYLEKSDIFNPPYLEIFKCREWKESQDEDQIDDEEIVPGNGKKSMAAFGAGALLGGSVAPAVTVAAVQTVGFGAAGITGGSTAAAMMSSAALANGGGVAAGSTIATLQSIGALGALTGGPLVLAIGIGVLVGGAIVGGVTIGALKLHESLKNPDKNCWDECCRHHKCNL